MGVLYDQFKRLRSKVPHVIAAFKYAEDVVDGKIPACLYVRQACQRQIDDLHRDDFEFSFDMAKAEKVCAFIERLPHVKGEWAKRRETIRLEPWQSFFLTTVFGWVTNEDEFEGSILIRPAGSRRFKSAYVEVPRKNAKSSIAAGIGLYMLTQDGEAGSEVYSSATTRNQAKIVFNVARVMALRADLGIGVRAHNLHHIETASLFEPLHAQGETLDGYNIYCAINDELHAWKKSAVYDVIESAMGARQQPLIFNITTAGDNMEGICFKLRGYSMQLLNHALEDDSFFGIIYTIDVEDRDHWLEREVWRKANPNWGVSVYPFDIESMAKKAKELPSEQNAFLTKRLNVWVNAAVAWMDMARWQACYDPTMKIEDFNGKRCFGGVDLASKIDINSSAKVFEVARDGKTHYYAFMRHWLPEEAIKSDRFGQYDGWVKMGLISKTPGHVIDTDYIEEDILDSHKQAPYVELGMDPLHNSTAIATHVAQQGVTVVDVMPSVKTLSEPMKWLEGWVKEGTFHFNCPVLTWMVSNVVALRDRKDNVYPRKDSVVRKIDGLVALLIAINRLKGATPAKKFQVMFL